MKLSKSKLAFAKVINGNGGWPQDSEWAVQNGDHGRISFSINKPVRNDSKSWMAKGGFNFKIEVCKPLKNWHQCVLNREEYYQAYPKADVDGWIEWKGAAKSPVSKGVAVDVKMKNGTQHFGQLIDDECWGEHWGDASIIAYRPHKQDVKPEFCESVMRSIPDPEAKPTIEHLAKDYRNAKGYADRKQQEADAAKADAEAKLAELVAAGKALGLVLSVVGAAPEPEMVITDWRDLQVNDVIFVGEYDGYESGEYVVVWLEDSDYDGDYAVIVVGIDGIERCMDTAMEWRFIRRP